MDFSAEISDEMNCVGEEDGFNGVHGHANSGDRDRCDLLVLYINIDGGGVVDPGALSLEVILAASQAPTIVYLVLILMPS